jgi:hypothetical protein
VSTRKAQNNSPLSQERYMSSPEYAELRGISGTALAVRTTLLDNVEHRRLLWFLQSCSLEPGGLKQVGEEVLKLNPRRDGSPQELAAFLTDLCINPCIALARANDAIDYRSRVRDEFPDHRIFFEPASLPWFPDVVEALLEYQRRHEEAERAGFVLTAIGRKVWETLDFALKSRRMVLIEGWEGRGKSEAARAWARAHRGEARFVDLNGITSKTSVFRAIAKALGIASSYSRTATEMQSRIEDVLQRSGLLLIADEAHFFFNQSARIYSRPELVDWIDTALANHDVPVALITTPQFIKCVKRAEVQVGWNWRQFRRRVARWAVLDKWNPDEDLKAVARKVLPGISPAGLKLAIGYAKMSLHDSPSRDVSGLGDVAKEARLFAQAAGRTTIAYEDVEHAINDYLIPSDTAFASGMAAAEKAMKPSRKRPETSMQGDLRDAEEPPAAPSGRATNFAGHKPAPHSDRVPDRSLELVAG